MSTISSHPSPPPVQGSALDAPPEQFDQLIEQQLRRTRAQVKLVDIVNNALLLVVGALGFMLAVALVDHWIMALGFWARLLALLVLIGGSGWWIAVRIVPLIIRRINPVYAAYTIEQAEPSLKNSLINFLLLRSQREKMHAVVYQAVGQRAASDLSHVPAENVVDYSHLLRIGYVLAALLVLGAVYKIASPKDPFQSAARVVAPWADIDRPSRVDIEEITPGDTTIFQGEHVEVAAIIRGADSDDEVRVLFSTLDGQLVDQQAAMRLDDAGLKHTAKIPGDEYGAQTSLQYKIVAGDAQTRWYNVEVIPAPHVLVTKVEYTPPRYTEREPFVDNRGDIDGLEGTLVTVHAQANREVGSAFLEFDPLPDGVTAEARAASDAESVRIRQIDGQNMQASFYLRLKSDRKTPWHKNYTIRFNTVDGYRNQKPVVHSIDVKPDLAPLAEILAPEESDIELPLNRKLEIEVRAIDPDFALRKLRLVAVSGGRDLLDVALLDAPTGRGKEYRGQVIRKFEFLPERYDLSVGDEVEYWAVAEDDRTAVKTNTPEPNVTRSRPNYRFTIVAPGSEKAEPSADDPRRDEAKRNPDEASDSTSGNQPQDRTGDKRPSNREKNSDASGEEGQQGEQGGNAGGNGSSESSNNTPEGSDSPNSEGVEDGAGQSSSQQGDSDATGDNQSGGQSGGKQPSQNQPGDSPASPNSKSTPNNGTAGENASGQAQNSNGGQQPSQPRDEPLENDGSRDGDIFETINEHRRQEQQNDGGNAAGESPNDSPDDLRDKNLNPDNDAGGSNNDNGQNQQNQDQTGGQSAGGQNGSQQQQNPGGSQSGGGTGAQQGERPQQGAGGDQQSGGSAGTQDQQNGSAGSQKEDPSGSAGSQQQPGNQSGGNDSRQNQGGANNQQQRQPAGGNDSQGGQPQGGAKPEADQNESGGGQKPQSGGTGQNDKSGAGQQSDGGGSPQSQAEDQQQRNQKKSGGGQQGGQKQEQGGKSPSGSNKDSDSQGESGGDRKGGGQQGGGQSSKQQGQDSAGSSSSGQQGDGAAQQPGAGQSGNRAGGDQIADSPTGRSGEQTGKGSNTGAADGGRQNQDRPREGDAQPGEASDSGNRPGGGQPRNRETGDSAGERTSGTPGEGRGTLPTGGGKPADNRPSDTRLPDREPGADEANLEYAREATDLTLDYLKSQKDEPDRELLDKLGWTKDDLNRFIQRWERMKRSAKTSGEESEAARRLDDSLRSLGLRPPRNKFRTSDAGGDRLSGQRDAAQRTRPPKEYAEQYRAFSKFVKPAGE